MALVERKISRDPCLKVPTKRYPIVHIHGGVVYETNKVTRDNIKDLRTRALPFEKEFGYGDSFLTHDKVRHYVREGGEVVFARTIDHTTRDIGVATQELKRVAVGRGKEVKVLSVGIRVVLAEHQDHGISTYMARESIMRLRPDAVTGQIRTWRIPCMYEDTRFFTKISPFDELLTPKNQRVLTGVLDRSTLAATNLSTGLCLGVFPATEAGRFIPPSTNERGVRYYSKIRALGADPAKGDAIRYFATVNQQAVEIAIARGYTAPEIADTTDTGLRAVASRPFLVSVFRNLGLRMQGVFQRN